MVINEANQHPLCFLMRFKMTKANIGRYGWTTCLQAREREITLVNVRNQSGPNQLLTLSINSLVNVIQFPVADHFQNVIIKHIQYFTCL